MATTTTESPVATRGLSEENLLDFVWIADPRISPDGSRIVFTRVHVDRDADEYRTALWIIGSDERVARPLTPGPKDSSARWSPDGNAIAFVRGGGPDTPAQIHVLPMSGGEATALTALAKGASSAAWSPDGRRIAFTSTTNPALDEPAKPKPKHEPARVVTKPVFRENNVGFTDYERRDHVWVIDAAGGTPRQLTTGAFAEESPRWSRDGRNILFASDRREEPWFGDEYGAIWSVPADLTAPTDGGAMQLLCEPGGAVHAFVEDAAGRLAIVGSQTLPEPRSYNQPALLLAEGAVPRRTVKVFDGDGQYAVGEAVNSDQHPPRGGGEIPLAFAGDGNAVIVRVSRQGGARLARIDLANGALTELTPAHAELFGGTCSTNGRRWALTLGGFGTPGDLFLLDVEAGALKKLYGPNDELLAKRAPCDVEEFWYDSFDGRKIQGWIVKPPDFDAARKYPLILEIHGGPHTAYGTGFFHEFHALANAGYVVLYTNPRGSTSYGLEFANVIQYRFPGDDAKDLLAGVDAVVKRGYIDEKRIGVTGGSGGGLLTNWLVCQSDRFAAAITQRCVTDWAQMYWSCDFAMYRPFWFRKPPHEDRDEWFDRSPLKYVENIKTPLMILHSEEDWRTPIAQGEILFRALKQLKRTVVMVRFPGENHELSRSGMPSRRVQNQQHIRAWFDRWLKDKPAPQYGV